MEAYQSEIIALSTRLGPGSQERLRMLRDSMWSSPRSLGDFQSALAYVRAYACVDQWTGTKEAPRVLDELILAYRQRDAALLSPCWDEPSACKIRESFQHVLRSQAGERSSLPEHYAHPRRRQRLLAGASEAD